jgi:glycosyltransferase involved in cell wall biosynthesis
VSSEHRAVFINGLGCLESGARLVLRELLRGYPASGPKAWVVVPACNREDFTGLPEQVRVIALSHACVGRWLRPLFETFVWLCGKLGVFSRIINLSHYGWCPGGHYTLYFHNDLLLGHADDVWVGHRGRPDALKRVWFHSCLRRAERIVVQTERTAEKMRAYAAAKKIALAPLNVVAPLPLALPVVMPVGAMRRFAFQFFYPASDFAHKRVELAVSAIKLAHARDARIGLVVTSDAEVSDGPMIQRIGRITHAQALAELAASDALLFTSSQETLGLPLLEAMALGKPAVLPTLDYARAIYAEVGVYFEDASAEGVAEAIMRCVQRWDETRASVGARAPAVWAGRVPWAGHWERFGLA